LLPDIFLHGKQVRPELIFIRTKNKKKKIIFIEAKNISNFFIFNNNTIKQKCFQDMYVYIVGKCNQQTDMQCSK